MTIHRSAFWAAITLIIALIALTALGRGTAQAKIYKFRDGQGKLHFTDDKNKIPLEYQLGPQTEEIRELPNLPSTSKPATPSSSGMRAGGAKGIPAGAAENQVGLTDVDTQLANDAITMMQKGVDLAREYKGLPNTSRIGKRLYNALRANLPAKESLVKKLAESKAPALVSTHSLLQKTLASDQATERVKPEMVRKIRNLINRIVSEAPAQKALIKKLNQALKNSEKEKAQSEKKKEQEKNSKTSENKK